MHKNIEINSKITEPIKFANPSAFDSVFINQGMTINYLSNIDSNEIVTVSFVYNQTLTEVMFGEAPDLYGNQVFSKDVRNIGNIYFPPQELSLLHSKCYYDLIIYKQFYTTYNIDNIKIGARYLMGAQKCLIIL